MKLIVEGNVVCSDPAPESITEALASLDGNKATFAVLERNKMTYMQTSGSVAEGFDLEYQDGSLQKHYYCLDSLSLEDVTGAFQSYANGGGEWQAAYKWEDETHHKKNTPKFTPNRQQAWAVLLFSLLWGGVILGVTLHELATGRVYFGGTRHFPHVLTPDRNPTEYWSFIIFPGIISLLAIGAGVCYFRWYLRSKKP